jgi:DNA-binding GntR family transcriptional regulator
VDIFPEGSVQATLEDYENGISIYGLLEKKGTPVHHGLARILPIKAGDDVALKLGINPETVILVIEQVDYSEDDHALLYTEEYHLRQAFQFTVYRVR